MYVSKIRMQNFRCYTDFTMHFSPGVTVIVAENGKGKTAILDGLAINMAPYLAAFPGIKGRSFQPNDVRMVMDAPSDKEELQIRRMKYLLPVVLETEVKADDGKAYSWKRELKTVKGKTSSVSAKFVSDYGPGYHPSGNRVLRNQPYVERQFPAETQERGSVPQQRLYGMPGTQRLL